MVLRRAGYPRVLMPLLIAGVLVVVNHDRPLGEIAAGVGGFLLLVGAGLLVTHRSRRPEHHD